MQPSPQGRGVLRELRDFLAFLQSLWGLLSGITVFFPLFNRVTNIIPVNLDYHPFARFNAEWVTTITLLVTLFIIFLTFGQRHDLTRLQRRQAVRQQARVSLGLGLLALLVYLAGYVLIGEGAYGPYEPGPTYAVRLVLGDTLLLITYCAFFALTTRAFELLAMIEYFGKGP